MKHFLPILFVWICGLYTLPAIAQKDTLHRGKPQVELSGFVDVFYAYDFNRPGNGYRQTFLYNHNRHNQVNFNLAYLKLSVLHPRYRIFMGLQAGTYVTDNYASEPRVLQYISEASVGWCISPKNNLWVDAGIFASHIGFESAVSLDNPTLTRSLIAENSPYYLAGAKLNYSPTPALELSALVCNGWQRIRPVRGNTLPGFGTQIKYTHRIAVLNWSTFIGTDDPNSSRRMRYFSNLYTQLTLPRGWALTAGIDAGIQQAHKHSSSYRAWWGAALLVRYNFHRQWAAALRGEYYHDPARIIVSTTYTPGLHSAGLSGNIDYQPLPAIALRVEARWLYSPKATFESYRGPQQHNVVVVASIAARINRLLNVGKKSP